MRFVRRIKRVALVLVLALGAAGCEGPMGPEGPPGSQGAQGQAGQDGQDGAPGPGTRIVLSGSLDSSGAGGVHLPEVAGTLSNPPAVSCYIAETSSDTVWLVIATSNLTGACGLIAHGVHVDIGIVGSEPFWAFKLVVVY